MKYLLFLIITCTVFLPLSARADTPVNFKKIEKYKELKALSLVEELKNNSDKYLIAPIDLNDDFIDEYVVKPNTCTTRHLCHFTVIAYMDKTPIEIGSFKAHRILISSAKDYGIRRLKLYNQPNNDFSSQEAKWDPYEFKYVYK